MPEDRKQEVIHRFQNNTWEEIADTVAVEEPLAVSVDGQTIHITLRTPGFDEELALGFLFSEGFIKSKNEVTFDSSKENTIAFEMTNGTQIDFSKLARHVMGSSSCGVCGKTSIDRVRLPFEPVRSTLAVKTEMLLSLPQKLRESQKNFHDSGGIHAAGIFTKNGDLIICREDIGRHNAVDKILGFGLLQGYLPFSEHILLVSGRTSFEIMQKSIAGGFPIIAAVSAPSSLAIQFARETGQTLIGFLREERFNVYAGKWRIRKSVLSSVERLGI